MRTPDLVFHRVGVAGRYSNRPELLQQLRKAVAIMSDGGQYGGTGAEVGPESVIRSRRLRDRFSSEDLQAMIDLYTSGTTAKQVAETFHVSLSSVKRLLHQHGVRRYDPTTTGGSNLVTGSSPLGWG
jgi:Helix-turn-helix domain of resolvase